MNVKPEADHGSEKKAETKQKPELNIFQVLVSQLS